jgi:predicted RNA-binding Zn-ribbon protein involved in translation (DUF1610 family)
MALIHCPECGSTISDRAEKCPNCGITLRSSYVTVSNPYKGKWLMFIGKLIGKGSLIFILFGFILGMQGSTFSFLIFTTIIGAVLTLIGKTIHWWHWV